MNKSSLYRAIIACTTVLCLGGIFTGCAKSSRDASGIGRPILFDPLPPRTAQTKPLREVRYRRFSSDTNHNQSEWRTEPSIWPVEHPERQVISRYGPRGRSRKMHNGIDIKAPHGTPVVATADGIVTFAGVRRGYGKVVEIDHGDGVMSLYAHLDYIYLEDGVSVEQGEEIGRLGDTGNASTPHVHYEVVVNTQCHDPWLFLPAVGP